MQKTILPVYGPLSALRVSRTSAQSIELQSRRGRIEVSVLASDLFRIRATSAKSFSTRPSWAVSKTEWPGVPSQIRTSPNQISIQTSRGHLGLRLDDGAWNLKDG